MDIISNTLHYIIKAKTRPVWVTNHTAHHSEFHDQMLFEEIEKQGT